MNSSNELPIGRVVFGKKKSRRLKAKRKELE
jgi:hypothetical protein